MASRYDSQTSNSNVKNGTITTQNTTEGFSPATSTSEGFNSSNSFQQSASDSESFSGISNPEALSALLDYIKQAASGGSETYKSQLAERQKQLANVQQLSGSYTTDAAFRDAAMLMQQNLQKSMEANMPAISKAITGAGTSAASMQGLLGQKLAVESAQAAGALGAEQSKAYGSIGANLAAVLEALSRIDTQGETNFLKALDLAKVATSSSKSRSDGSSSSYGQQTSQSVGATPGNQTQVTTSGSGSSTPSQGTPSGSSGATDEYTYIPYDLTNPGFVNPYSSSANQQSAQDFQGYTNYWGD